MEWSLDIQNKLIISAVVIFGLLGVRLLLFQFVYSGISQLKMRYNWRKTTTYVLYFLIFLFILTVWFKEFQSVATFLGLLSAGLAVALRDPIVNFFGWIFILLNRPFEMGDRLEIGHTKGDVLDISVFKFTLLEIGVWVDANQSTGRIVHIPNGKIFTEALINFTQGFQYIWHEIPITLTFDSNWQRAKNILLDIENQRVKALSIDAQEQLNESEKKFNIHYSNLTPTVYTSIREHGIRLTLRYLCHPRNQRSSEQTIIEEMLQIFPQHADIRFAYPSQHIYLRQPDDKQQTNDSYFEK